MLNSVLKSLTVGLKMWEITNLDHLQAEDVKYELELNALDRWETRVEHLTLCGTLRARRGREVHTDALPDCLSSRGDSG